MLALIEPSKCGGAQEDRVNVVVARTGYLRNSACDMGLRKIIVDPDEKTLRRPAVSAKFNFLNAVKQIILDFLH